MSGQEKLVLIAFVVSALVIATIAVTYAILFYLYGKYKTLHLKRAFEDETIEKYLTRRYARLIERKREEGGTKALVWSYTHCVRKDQHRGKISRIFVNVVFVLLALVLLAAFIAAAVFNAQNQEFYVGNVTYLTIRTGSMSEASSANEYLKTENLTDRIEQYALIGIEKTDESDIKLYDIVAYRHEDEVIVHRIIKITEGEDGGLLYTLRGDANAASFSYEKNITFDRFVGRYTGYQNYGLGILFTYLQSNIGLIALAFGFLVLIIADITEDRISAVYDARILYVAGLLDREGAGGRKALPAESAEEKKRQKKPAGEKRKAVGGRPVPVPVAVPVPVPVPVMQPPVPVLMSAPPAVFGNARLAALYDAVRAELLAYAGVLPTAEGGAERFVCRGRTFARLAAHEKAVLLYLPLRMNSDEKLGVRNIAENAAKAGLADTPLLIFVCDGRRLRLARKLVRLAAKKHGIPTKAEVRAKCGN